MAGFFQVDETGIQEKDVKLVMQQASVSRKAVRVFLVSFSPLSSF